MKFRLLFVGYALEWKAGTSIACLNRGFLNKYFTAFYNLNGDGSIFHRVFVFDCMMVLKTKRSRDFMMCNGAAIAAPLC